MKLNEYEVPEGYITGLVRDPGADKTKVAHLYKGDFSDPGLPMCRRGWNRGDEYSIWRNNVGEKGVCRICLRRAAAGKPGIDLKA